MTFSYLQLALAGGGYLLLLYLIAESSERGLIPSHISRHPITYTLSLGVIASSFTLFGIVGLAYDYGYGFLAYYGGITAAFLFAPLILSPLLRLCRVYQLSSLADIITFRFRSQWAGSLTTAFMLIGMLPLMALQIEVVSQTLQILTEPSPEVYASHSQIDWLALSYCAALILLTIMLSSRHITAHERHSGLVMAIAFESLIKLLVVTALGAAAIYSVFGGFSGLDRWLMDNPSFIQALNSPLRQDAARSLLLIFFSAAVTMPHLFHMLFAENPSAKALRTASWGLPLYLCLLSLPILPILWSGFAGNSTLPPDYFSLSLGGDINTPLLSLLSFVGGLSAASGSMVVITLAIASMLLNHLILPFYQPGAALDIYRWLLWTRRLMISAIIAASALFYHAISGQVELTDLAMSSFIATLQFLPGILATLYWPKANRKGFLAGLLAGYLVWFFTLLLPLVSDFNPTPIVQFYLNWPDTQDIWIAATLLSLGANTLIFAATSWLTRPDREEQAAAELCATDDLNRPIRQQLTLRTPAEFRERLTKALGSRSAEREVGRAMAELQIRENEQRPAELRRLRRRLETNLSGLLGPSVAHDLINQLIPYVSNSGEQTEDINLIESRLERYQTHLTGLAADLDALRRYHRQTLEDLPIGVCSLGRDHEILMWNRNLEQLTGIAALDIVGSHLDDIPAPWSDLLSGFIHSPVPHLHKQHLQVDGLSRWITLHKATSQGPQQQRHDGEVIILEDVTENRMLEHELTHSERLASIGRLAAGVAHEIGNPVTGIACLAQNLHYDTDNPESLATADDILKQTQRITKIVQTLVSFAHAGSDPGNSHPHTTSISECVDEAIHLLQLNKEAKSVVLSNLCDPQTTLFCDSQRLLQVFVNLLGNARDASPEGASIEVTSGIDPQGRTLIEITDHGSGIESSHLEQIFEPFFTTKEPGEGTGLGLALVYSIVDEFGGHIQVDSPLPDGTQGTRFSLTFTATG